MKLQVVTNIQLARGGGGTLYTPEEFVTFSPQDILDREQFAKVEFASEQVSHLRCNGSGCRR